MNYIEARSFESHGIMGAFGLKILVSIDRPLAESDYVAIGQAAAVIEKALLAESVRLDPENIKNAADERAQILGLFPEPIYVEEIPNAYCSDWCCVNRPWFVVTTKIGRITIGWRKRVIHIGWMGTLVNQTAEELFPTEDVTRHGQTIHAWGIDKARAYIARLLAGETHA